MYLLPTYDLVKDSKCHFNKRRVEDIFEEASTFGENDK